MQGRSEILEWTEDGRIAARDLRRALELAGALPDAGAWRQFLDRLLLFAGTVLVAAGLIFFLAFNWHDLGRMAKFAMVEVVLVAALAAVWRFGVEHIAGKAALLGAALFTGALFALIGQTYQTGADTFELFAVWALAVLPWALVARFPALWLFWLLLGRARGVGRSRALRHRVASRALERPGPGDCERRFCHCARHNGHRE
jgi:uncharacterized membrane protein